MTLLIEAFAELGRAFAEQTGGGISDPDVLTYVNGVVHPMIGGRNLQIKNVKLDGDTFKGEAHDKVNARLTKRFAFEISPDAKSFHPLNADEIEFFSEPVEFQAGGKKLNCKISACGGRCLRNGEKCRLTMSAEEHKAHVTALRKAGTVDTSLAKKRRAAKEAREADKKNNDPILKKGDRVMTDMKVVAKRMEKGLKDLQAQGKTSGEKDNVASIDAKRQTKSKATAKSIDVEAASSKAGVDAKAAGKKVKPTIPPESVETLLDTIGNREYDHIQSLIDKGKNIHDEARSAPERLMSAASEYRRKDPIPDTITENITYARSNKLSGGALQQKAHEEAARALISVADDKVKKQVFSYYKGNSPENMPPIAKELMDELGAKYNGNQWVINSSPSKEKTTTKKESSTPTRQPKSRSSADIGASSKIHSVTKQQDFDDLVMHVHDKLAKQYDGLVPIYKIRREIGELVPRNKFNEWLKDMQASDKLQLSQGTVNDSSRDKIKDSVTTELDGIRAYALLAEKGNEAREKASKRSAELEKTLKNRPELNPMGTASQLSKGSKIKTQSEFDKVALDAHKRLDEEFNHDNLVPIADLRKALGDRVSKKQFDDHLLELQANDKVQLVGNENAPKELQDGGVSTSLGEKRVYMRKL